MGKSVFVNALGLVDTLETVGAEVRYEDNNEGARQLLITAPGLAVTVDPGSFRTINSRASRSSL